MTDENNSSFNNSANDRKQGTSTTIDLGEDLLQKTRVISRPSVPQPHETRLETQGSTTELLQNAKILIQEGLTSDAKKVLHRVLIRDQKSQMAQSLLKEVNESELKSLLGQQGQMGRGSDPNSDDVDVEKLVQALNDDLELGLGEAEILESFSSERNGVGQGLENQLSEGSSQDWIDLGVAFLEMNDLPAAVRLFEGARSKIAEVHYENQDTYLSASSLLAWALIQSGRFLEAVSVIQPILSNSTLSPEISIEFYYLMGRTYESMKHPDLAQSFFLKVEKMNPQYRGVRQKLKKRQPQGP